MLKELLPSLFDKKNAQPIQKQNLPPQSLEKSSGSGDIEFSPNLISTSQQFYVIPKYATKLMLLIRKFIVMISVLFGVALLVNFAVYQIIKVQKNLQNDLLSEVSSYADIEARAKEVDAKTVAYKKFLNERKSLLSKTKFILDNVGSNIEIKSVDINHTSFNINLSGKSALEFTNLISRYLEKDMLSEIIINSASLKKSEGVLNVSLKGNFR
jgi:hypothetical protein